MVEHVKPVTVKLPVEWIDALNKLARVLGTSRSELIREGLRYVFKKYWHILAQLRTYPKIEKVKVIEIDLEE